ERLRLSDQLLFGYCFFSLQAPASKREEMIQVSCLTVRQTLTANRAAEPLILMLFVTPLPISLNHPRRSRRDGHARRVVRALPALRNHRAPAQLSRLRTYISVQARAHQPHHRR